MIRRDPNGEPISDGMTPLIGVKGSQIMLVSRRVRMPYIRICREARVQSWSGSMLGKNPAEYRKVAVMSQGQFSKCVFGDPCDGIVFVWRNVDRRPHPRFDQPDLHVERVGTNF